MENQYTQEEPNKTEINKADDDQNKLEEQFRPSRNTEKYRQIKDKYRQEVTFNTKYELYIYLSNKSDDSEYKEWETRYKEKVKLHNSKIMSGESMLDSGFDLFMPKNGVDYGSGEEILVKHSNLSTSVGADGARALNMGVRCCMRENIVIPITMPESDYNYIVSDSPNGSILRDRLKKPKLTKRACGYYLYPRSSISKTRMRIANSVGIIDAGYRGDIIAAVDTIGVFGSSDIWHVWKETLMHIKKYDRYFQICAPDLSPFIVHIVDNESELGEPTARGVGGFGSTGA